ncbi:lipopolysaccharide transport periplasmic protein LptA [Endozoicomonas sp. Mp262]|uniref:lipopolysaccharide transport periplasmic protein LptA n=1 Tax=Endozoicomonas sp. Mp262 TaxID=2919499 RepID=UPI0021E03786
MNRIKSFFLVILMLPGIAAALQSDRQKPIEIESNSADLDNKKGISVYRGNVIMTQGSTRIEGDLITIYNDAHRKVTRVVAKGQRAYYEQQQENGKGKLKAWGNTINYDAAGDRIELLQQGELTQEGDVFKGEKIEYNLKLQTVNASGQPAGNGEKGRVIMVIQPRPEPKAATPPAN